MPSGHPATGPHAGKGKQKESVTCPKCGETYNAHYDAYGRDGQGHDCKPRGKQK